MDLIAKRVLKLLPNYETLKTQLMSMSRRCSNKPSGRFEELLKIVRDFLNRVKKDPSSRAIIFVHMRRTCLKLQEELNKDTEIREKLKPLACVGHGNGFDGMQWKGEQEIVINK